MGSSLPVSDSAFKQPYLPQRQSAPLSLVPDSPRTISPSRASLRDGVVTAVAKFQFNMKTDKQNAILSRTFGKVAIVDRAWSQTMQGHIAFPAHDEFWLVDVVKDQFPGTNRGVLILHPRYPLAAHEPTRLFPGTFEEELQDGILYVRPKHPGPYWISSLSLKDALMIRYGKPTGMIVTIQPPNDAIDRAAASLKRAAESR